MKHTTRNILSVLALATLQACSSLPADNMALDAATQDMAKVQGNAEVQRLAPNELNTAQVALNTAKAAWTNQAPSTEVNHLAYLARQSVAVAVETTRRKLAEAEIANADKARTNLLLAARSDETSQAQRDAQAAKMQAQDATAQTAAANQRAVEAQTYAAQMQAEYQSRLAELNAKETVRGYVVTLGDIHFDNNRAELKSSASNSVERLGAFLLKYPQRKVLAEGYTDNVGSADSNMDLSVRRANAVRLALIGMGVDSNRIATHGYGETYPVSTNGTPEGREANRRVEVVLSDDKGGVVSR
jgi:outer membrane protein OmpA-like peptidoglycan-associated protein